MGEKCRKRRTEKGDQGKEGMETNLHRKRQVNTQTMVMINTE